MSNRMFYTKIHRIPVFRVIIRDDGLEPLVDFYNSRTKVHETMSILEFHAELDRLIFGQWLSLSYWGWEDVKSINKNPLSVDSRLRKKEMNQSPICGIQKFTAEESLYCRFPARKNGISFSLVPSLTVARVRAAAVRRRYCLNLSSVYSCGPDFVRFNEVVFQKGNNFAS